MLTVTRNSGGLENLEAIGSVKGGDLSVGELGEELGLFVVLEVDVTRREIDLQAGESSHSANLTVAKSDRGRFVGAGCDETHALAVSLLGDRVEGADGCHFVRRGDGEVGGESKLCDLAFFSPSVITDHPTAHVTHLLEGRRGLQAALGGGRGRRGTPRLLSSDHLVFEIIICPRSPSAPSPVRLSNACRMRVVSLSTSCPSPPSHRIPNTCYPALRVYHCRRSTFQGLRRPIRKKLVAAAEQIRDED